MATESKLQLRSFVIASAVITALFYKPLSQLVTLSLGSELYSHLILIPFVSTYLAWTQQEKLPSASPPKRNRFLFPIVFAALALILTWLLKGSQNWAHENYLAAQATAYVALIYASALYSFGSATLRAQFFPLAFLLCFIPLPTFIVHGIEVFFQYTSAEVSHWLIQLIDLPVFREDWLTFKFSTIRLHVATECSGIRASLVLFIVSLIASHLFLKTRWKQVALVVFIIPLAIFRNAVRVTTIAALCVHIGPEMIDSWIHHHGGPFFFALSMGPFILVLYLLWRSERAKSPTSPPATETDAIAES